MQIEFKDFEKMKIVTGKVLEVEKIRKSNKLYKLRVDIGEKIVQIVSGLANYYSESELIGKTVIVLANLAPLELMGEISEGMLLCAVDQKNDRCSLLTVDKDAEEGTPVM